MARPVPLSGQGRGRGGVAAGACGEKRREGKHQHKVTHKDRLPQDRQARGAAMGHL
jgi:hypothetical protein